MTWKIKRISWFGRVGRAAGCAAEGGTRWYEIGAGDKTGDGRQKTGDRKWEMEDRREETGDRKEMGFGTQDMAGGRQETGSRF